MLKIGHSGLREVKMVIKNLPPPNVEKIAEKQDLIAVESDWTTVAEAIGGGGIGSSFEFVPDPSSRFGIRQQRWLETMFGDGTITLRPVTSRDAEGNQVLLVEAG